MSRFLCPHCDALHSTTAYPNELEGYFVSDYRASNAGRVDLEEWLDQRGQPATWCPTCGVVTLDEPGVAEAKR